MPLPIESDVSNVPDIMENPREARSYDNISSTPSITTASDELDEEINISFPPAPQRHNNRQRKPPYWMEDFVVNTSIVENSSTINTPNTLNNSTVYTPHTYPYNVTLNFRIDCIFFLTNVSSTSKPHSYDQAKINYQWVHDMDEEIRALE